MDSKSKDLYFVAVKLFLRDGDKLLVIHDIFGAWDLPGGRIAERKVREELGPEVKYKLGEPNGIFFRVERWEEGLDKTVRIFAFGYDAEYLGGKVEPGKHIEKCEWVDIKTFKPEESFEGDWLAGVQEYLAKAKNDR
jgi:hypothetical protein